jgi:hypothetical protein
MTAPRSGLGRGLAAIFTGPASHGDDSVRSRLIDSSLTSLEASGSLRLCGYLRDLDGNPSVTLRSPELSELHPTEAFQLFSTLGAVGQNGSGDHRFHVSKLDAIAVVTSGPQSTDLFFFGADDLTEEQAAQLARFCRVYAPAIHQCDQPPDDTEQFHLLLDVHGDDARAEVTLGHSVGVAASTTSHEAAAAAALEIVAGGARLIEAGHVRSSDGTAAFVVVAGHGGEVSTGAAPVVAGPDASAAVAALRAGRMLVAGIE